MAMQESGSFPGIQFDYSGARVLVTGGSNGIGLGIAKAYMSAGADVTITGRRHSADDYDHDLSGFAYHQLDVTDRNQITTVFKAIQALDILINNAGGRQFAHDSEWDPAGFEAALDVNLRSVFDISNAALKTLKASTFPGGASNIGISSVSGCFSFEPAPGYSAAKTAMTQLYKTYSTRWAADGIRCNCIAPGLTASNLTDTYKENIPPQIAKTPIARLGQPEDIAAAVLFFTSPAASWITGQTLIIDGGYTVRDR